MAAQRDSATVPRCHPGWTEEGQLVLGLSMDDPKNDPQLLRQAAALMTSLIQELGASSGIAGVELSPPQSTTEWDNAELV
jgi:hypothetical protein